MTKTHALIHWSHEIEFKNMHRQVEIVYCEIRELKGKLKEAEKTIKFNDKWNVQNMKATTEELGK